MFTPPRPHVSPGLSVTSKQVDKSLNLSGRDVFFQELAVVVQQRGDRVLSQDLVPDLGLHDCKLFGDIFLRGYMTYLIAVTPITSCDSSTVSSEIRNDEIGCEESNNQ